MEPPNVMTLVYSDKNIYEIPYKKKLEKNILTFFPFLICLFLVIFSSFSIVYKKKKFY